MHQGLRKQSALFHQQDLIEVNAITTNDVGAVGRSLGVEAARAALLTEVTRVFGVYGIGVGSHHLALLTDFMTHHVRSPALCCPALTPTAALPPLKTRSTHWPASNRPTHSWHSTTAANPIACCLQSGLHINHAHQTNGSGSCLHVRQQILTLSTTLQTIAAEACCRHP